MSQGSDHLGVGLASPRDSTVPRTPRISHPVPDDQSVPRTPANRCQATQHSPWAVTVTQLTRPPFDGTPRRPLWSTSNLNSPLYESTGTGNNNMYLSAHDQLVPSTPRGLNVRDARRLPEQSPVMGTVPTPNRPDDLDAEVGGGARRREFVDVINLTRGDEMPVNICGSADGEEGTAREASGVLVGDDEGMKHASKATLGHCPTRQTIRPKPMTHGGGDAGGTRVHDSAKLMSLSSRHNLGGASSLFEEGRRNETYVGLDRPTGKATASGEGRTATTMDQMAAVASKARAQYKRYGSRRRRLFEDSGDNGPTDVQNADIYSEHILSTAVKDDTLNHFSAGKPLNDKSHTTSGVSLASDYMKTEGKPSSLKCVSSSATSAGLSHMTCRTESDLSSASRTTLPCSYTNIQHVESNKSTATVGSGTPSRRRQNRRSRLSLNHNPSGNRHFQSESRQTTDPGSDRVSPGQMGCSSSSIGTHVDSRLPVDMNVESRPTCISDESRPSYADSISIRSRPPCPNLESRPSVNALDNVMVSREPGHDMETICSPNPLSESSQLELFEGDDIFI